MELILRVCCVQDRFGFLDRFDRCKRLDPVAKAKSKMLTGNVSKMLALVSGYTFLEFFAVFSRNAVIQINPDLSAINTCF